MSDAEKELQKVIESRYWREPWDQTDELYLNLYKMAGDSEAVAVLEAAKLKKSTSKCGSSPSPQTTNPQ